MPKTSVTNLTANDMLQWNGTNWVNTSVLAGVRASSVAAGGINGQAMTSNGPNANPEFQGMTTQGDVEYHNGTDRVRLAPGTSGQFLKTQGAAANPVWGDPPRRSGINIDVTTAQLAPNQSETTMKSYTLIGGTLGINDGIYIQFWTQSSQPQTLRIKFGSTTLTTITTSSVTRMVHVWVYNSNSASVQRSWGYAIQNLGGAEGIDNGFESVGAMTENTANDVNVLLTGETDTNSSLTIYGWVVEHIRL